jgi:hypothetical protein
LRRFTTKLGCVPRRQDCRHCDRVQLFTAYAAAPGEFLSLPIISRPSLRASQRTVYTGPVAALGRGRVETPRRLISALRPCRPQKPARLLPEGGHSGGRELASHAEFCRRRGCSAALYRRGPQQPSAALGARLLELDLPSEAMRQLACQTRRTLPETTHAGALKSARVDENPLAAVRLEGTKDHGAARPWPSISRGYRRSRSST